MVQKRKNVVFLAVVATVRIRNLAKESPSRFSIPLKEGGLLCQLQVTLDVVLVGLDSKKAPRAEDPPVQMSKSAPTTSSSALHRTPSNPSVIPIKGVREKSFVVFFLSFFSSLFFVLFIFFAL